MRAPLFLKNKVSRLLSSQGKEYQFTHMGEDKYHQPVEDSIIVIKGFYHENNSFITLSSADAASVQRKKSPMILALIDENVSILRQGDTVKINEVTYKVSGIIDIQNYGIVADISLEMEV